MSERDKAPSELETFMVTLTSEPTVTVGSENDMDAVAANACIDNNTDMAAVVRKYLKCLMNTSLLFSYLILSFYIGPTPTSTILVDELLTAVSETTA